MTTTTTTASNADKAFTRDDVAAALIAAGAHLDSTDADIRRLTEIQFSMIASDVATLNREDLDETTLRLLDHFTA